MKKFFDWRIIIIILLIIILSIMLLIYFNKQNEPQVMSEIFSQKANENLNTNDEQNSTSNSNKILQTSSEIISGLSENIELHVTYYLEECYVQTNQEVKEGENILRYTNGTYLVAPYDCVITKLNIPSESEKCTNEHYISISSINTLAIQFKVDESKINEIYIGQSTKIKISAFDEEEVEGYITKISSTASNGKFTITTQFENDGKIKIGMTANIEI